MMRPRIHRQRTRPNHERWLVSYADFITLLFAFFVVLYASSQSDQKKAARVANAIEHAFRELGIGQGRNSATPSVPAEASSITRGESDEIGRIPRQMNAAESNYLGGELQKALGNEIAQAEVNLRTTPEGVVVSLRELGFFDSGSASLRPESQATFGHIADVLAERHCQIRIEGHTDPIPIHNAQFESNWELSTARATGLVKLLIQKYHYDAAQLSAGGYAEFHPIASNETLEGRRTNRRVDLVITSAAVPRLPLAAH